VQIALYKDHASEARAHVDDLWPVLTGSMMLRRVQLLRIEAAMIRGRAYLAWAIARDGAARRDALAVLRRTIKGLLAEKTAWTDAIAAMLRAGCAAITGDRAAAARDLEHAERSFAAADMHLFVDVVRLRSGQLEGGLAGDARASAAIAAIRERGVADPSAIARVLCPWPA